MLTNYDEESSLLIELKDTKEYIIVADLLRNFASLPKQSAQDFFTFFKSIDINTEPFQSFQELMKRFEGG